MELCSSGHSEVCYERGSCPACEVIDERDTAQGELKDAQNQVSDLERDNERLQNKINELEGGD